MSREHKIADKLSYQDLYRVQDYLIEMSDTSIILNDVWKDIGKIIQTSSNINKKDFLNSVAINIKLHRLCGYKVKEDKLVLNDLAGAKENLKRLLNPPPEETTTIVDDDYLWNSIRRPLTTMKRTQKLWIKDSCYNIPMAPTMIKDLLVKVFLAKKNADGKVIFDGQNYVCDDQLVHRYFCEFLGVSPTVEEYKPGELPDWLQNENPTTH